MHIAPFAHSERRKKIRVQLLIEFAMRFFVRERFFIERPQIDESQKLRLRMGKFFMGDSGVLLLVMRPQTRILHRQRGRDFQYLREAAFTLGGEQHAGDGRINRKFRQLPAECGQRLVVIDRTEFE